MLLQLRINDSYDQYHNVQLMTFANFTADRSFYNLRNLTSNDEDQDIVEFIELSFESVAQNTLITEWVQSVLIPILYQNDNKTYLNQNYIIGDPMLNLLVRILKEKTNKNSNTNTVLPAYTTHKTYDYNEDLEDEAYTRTITLNSSEVVNFFKDEQYELTGLGGYKLEYSRNKTEAESLNYTGDTNLISRSWTSIVYSWMHVNRNTDKIALNLFYFTKNPSGNIEGFHETHSTRDFYAKPIDHFRLFLEILFLLFTSWFLLQLIISVYLIFKKVFKERYDSQSDHMKKQGCFRYLEIDRDMVDDME